MPELPEVQALAEYLHGRLAGATLASVHVTALNALQTFDPPTSALHGLAIDRVRRRGKVLLFDVDEFVLATHLSKAGWVRWSDKQPSAAPKPGRGPIAARVRCVDLPHMMLDDSTTAGFDLTEAGTKKRLAIWVARNDDDIPAVARLGVEPLSDAFTPQVLHELLHAERKQLKGLLRSQQAIAGIGNAYSDEILHAAQLSPFAMTTSLDESAAAQLHQVIVNTLSEAVAAAQGKPAAELKDAKRATLRVHGRAGQQCDVCDDTIAEVSFADSALQYCPTCQTGGKPLADRRLSKLLK